jgi:dienelactone hydrolase
MTLAFLLCSAAQVEFAAPADDARTTHARTLDDEHLFVPPKTLEDWTSRRDQLRTRILVAAGLWPLPERRPLQARIEGSIQREGYTIQSVAFESFPGFYVTGSLYRPDPMPASRVPGVLCPHGHWTNGRFCERTEAEGQAEIERGAETHMANARYHLQARSASLARMGCIVFQYDMIGYADSIQLAHDTGFEDADALLELQSDFGLQTWDSIRALDFLAALPEVDPARIGVTGASGGGTQTFILCAIDERPRVAFPAVMVSCAMQGGCVCENAPYLRIGTDNVEIAALMAPRPLGLTGAHDWTIEIEKKGLPELRAIYGLYGHPEAVFGECHPEFDHNYNQVSRELCYRWFARWLELTAPSSEAEIVPVPPAELSVWKHIAKPPVGGEVLRKVRDVWRADTHAALDALERVPSQQRSLDRQRLVLPALDVILDGSSVPMPDRAVAERVVSRELPFGKQVELRLSREGAKESVPATMVVPSRWTGRVAVVVTDKGRASLFAGDSPLSPQRLAEAGILLLAVDPYQTGTWLTDGSPPRQRVDAERHGTYAGYSFAYDRPLTAERVHDVLTAIAYARSVEEDFTGSRSIVLVGLGEGGSWAWLARAVARTEIARTIIERAGDPWEVAAADDPRILPGIRKYRGKYDLAPLVFPGELVLLGTGKLLSHAAEYYSAAGNAGSIRQLDASEARDLVPWITAKLDDDGSHATDR